MLSKAFDQITPDDIADLCARGGAYESVALEFKRELPGRNGRPDPWIDGRDFTSYARDRLFREVVAFANAQGGTLVLGVEETEDQPPRAQRIVAIPRVHDLAARLEEAARACIEPPLSSLLVRGIVTDGADGGVVIFRTVVSPFGPHRVAGDGHAFIRRGASSVTMTMREIQDLTLDLARGADRLDEVFRRRASLFTHWFRSFDLSECGGFRITAVPIGRMPGAIRIADQPEEFRFEPHYQAQLDRSGTRYLQVPIHSSSSRPIIRGIRKYERDERFSFQLDVLDSGLVDFWLRHRVDEHLHLDIGWILGAYLAVLEILEWIRRIAAAPEWEFAIALSLEGLARHGVTPTAPRVLPQLTIGTMGRGTIKIDEPPIAFPRVVSRSPVDDEEIINLVLRDLLNASGSQSSQRISLRL
jgi:hypothetical protein